MATTFSEPGADKCLVLPISASQSVIGRLRPTVSGSYVITVLPCSTSYNGKNPQSTAVCNTSETESSGVIQFSGHELRILPYTKPSLRAYHCALAAFFIRSSGNPSTAVNTSGIFVAANICAVSL